MVDNSEMVNSEVAYSELLASCCLVVEGPHCDQDSTGQKCAGDLNWARIEIVGTRVCLFPGVLLDSRGGVLKVSSCVPGVGLDGWQWALDRIRSAREGSLRVHLGTVSLRVRD
jgi:hypothetical protein